MHRRRNDRRPSIANVIERKRFQSLRKDCRLETQSISGPAFVREINGRPNKWARGGGSFADAPRTAPLCTEIIIYLRIEKMKMFTADKLPGFSAHSVRRVLLSTSNSTIGKRIRAHKGETADESFIDTGVFEKTIGFVRITRANVKIKR